MGQSASARILGFHSFPVGTAVLDSREVGFAAVDKAKHFFWALCRWQRQHLFSASSSAACKSQKCFVSDQLLSLIGRENRGDQLWLGHPFLLAAAHIALGAIRRRPLQPEAEQPCKGMGRASRDKLPQHTTPGFLSKACGHDCTWTTAASFAHSAHPEEMDR